MTWTEAAAVLEAIAWPLAVATIVIVLREPLAKLADSLGNRVTALGIGTFSIEFEAAKASALSVSWKIGEIDARRLTSSTVFDTASDSLFNQIMNSQPADYSIVNLEDGHGWLASRLFIFTVLMHELHGARVFVFVESRGYQHEVYVGHASLSAVREALGRTYPWFEVALAEVTSPPPSTARQAVARPEILSFDSCDMQRLKDIVQGFTSAIQRTPQDPGMFDEAEWLSFKDDQGNELFERTEWLNSVRLRRTFGHELQREYFIDDPDRIEADRAASVIARKGEFVAAVDAQERLLGLVDRRALMARLSPQLARVIRGT